MNMVKVVRELKMPVRHMVEMVEKVVCLVMRRMMVPKQNMPKEKVVEMVLQLEYQEMEVLNLTNLVEQRLMVVHPQLVSVN